MKPCFLTTLLLAACLVLSTSAMAFCDVNDLSFDHHSSHDSLEWPATADSHDDKHAHHCHKHFVGDVSSVSFIKLALLPEVRQADLKTVVLHLSYPPLNPPPNA